MLKSLDDSQLLRVVSDPRLRLFPSLRGATVFGPIVLLAGLIPCIAVVLSSELNDESAGWALRALDVSAALQIDGWLEPGRDGLGSALVDQPPLVAWLLALIVPSFGTSSSTSWLALSLAATCCTIWMVYLLARRLGGAAFGLAVTLMICSHPVVLRLATETSPAALGILLIVVTVWGFLGHLEEPPQLVSIRMLVGAVAWGLALLAVGPVAIALLLPMAVHVWLLAGERIERTDRERASRWWQIWLGTRSLVVFAVTAISFSGWWEIMMLASHGSRFWNAWWTGHVNWGANLGPTGAFWHDWLRDNFLICGWLLIGIAETGREIRSPDSELSRRRSQFVLGWWLTAFGIRILFHVPELRQSVLNDSWDGFLLVPTALVAARGVRVLVLRQAGSFIEAIWFLSTCGLGAWRVTDRPMVGIAGLCGGFLFLAILPALAARFRRTTEPFKDRDWRRVLRTLIACQFVWHLATGLLNFPGPTPDNNSLGELHRRISAIPPAPKVTLMTLTTAPESLVFALRSAWPNSQFVLARSRDGSAVTDALAPLPAASAGSEIVIEWTRREFRLATEFTPNRQTTAIGDPIRFRGRRLMVYQISPRDRQ